MKLLAQNRASARRRLLALACMLIFCSSQAVALEYKTTLAPIDDAVLAEAVKASSVLIELEAKPPDNLYGLRRRAQEDETRLAKALRSSGYYDGDVSIEIAGRSADDPSIDELPESKEAIPVKIEVHPGKLYRLREIKITGGEVLSSKL